MSRRPTLPSLVAALLFAGAGCQEQPPVESTRESLDPALAGARVAELLAIRDPVERMAELAPVFPGLAPEALPGLLEAYEGSGLGGGDPELVLLGLWWAGFDPKSAVQWTKTDWRAGQAPVVEAVYRSWAHREPQKAFASARGFSYRNLRSLVIEAAIAGWDESGQPGLDAAVQGLRDDVDRQRIAEVLARRRVVSLGSDGALEWMEGLSSQFKKIMRPRVLSAIAHAEPERAARWAERRIRTSEEPTGYPRRIATRWVRHEPRAAMAWLSTLPAGYDRNDGVAEAFRDWVAADREAASAWIEEVEIEPWNEPAFYIHARQKGIRSPEEGLAVAARISDDLLRRGAQTATLRFWIRNDPDAAEAWMEEMDIPEQQRIAARMARVLKPEDLDPEKPILPLDEKDL